MAGQVVQMRVCKCGKPARRMELAFQDETVGSFNACGDCLEETIATLDRVRPVFDAMTMAGISREHANLTMTYLLGLAE